MSPNSDTGNFVVYKPPASHEITSISSIKPSLPSLIQTTLPLQTLLRLRQEVSVPIPPVTMKRHPTPAELAGWLNPHASELAGGALAVVSPDGHISIATVGVPNINDENEKVTPKTPFMLGSIVKVLTALLITQQVGEGKLSLDDSVFKHIPHARTMFSSSGSGSEPDPTLRHLLTHSSGLVDLFEPVQDLEDFISKMSKHELLAPPGEVVSYTNAGYVLLGAVLSKVTGLDWTALVQTRIIDKLNQRSSEDSNPIKMELDITAQDSAPRSPIAEDHIINPSTKLPMQTPLWPRLPGLFSPAGTTTAATVRDTATLFHSILPTINPSTSEENGQNTGRGLDLLLPDRSLQQELRKLQIGLPGPSAFCDGWGLGWCVVDAARGLVGHMGASSNIIIGDVNTGALACFLSNTASGAMIGRELALQALGVESVNSLETARLSQPQPADLDPKLIQSIIGSYGNPPFLMEVLKASEGLSDAAGGLALKSAMDASGEPAPLVHVSGLTFKGELMSMPADFTFVRDADNVGGKGDSGVRYLHAMLRVLPKRS